MDTLAPGVTNSRKHFIITLQHINSLGQICAFWQLDIKFPPRGLPPSFTLHCSSGGSGPGAWWERLEKGGQAAPVPLSVCSCGGLCLSSAWVAAGVEGPLLRGEASKEGVQQGLRQCDALGRVKF